MSHDESPRNRGMRRILDEARTDIVPKTHAADHDWSALDRKLMQSLAAPRAAAPRSRPVFAVASGLALAAAAAATLFLRTPPPVATMTSAPVAEIAASVTGAQGLRINGEVRSGSTPVRVGDRLETTSEAEFHSLDEHGARAVSWRLEGSSNVLVASARRPLGLALENGAVEANVARVASGEAFVVDVGPVRVAVRGTHLRVARTGDRASVDLTEGTIAIGSIPAPGAMTQGELVSAPAHVDIDLTKPQDIKIDRKQEMVRAPSPKLPTHAAARPAGEVPRLPPLPAPPATNPPAATPVPNVVETRTPLQILSDSVRACVERHVSAGAVHVTVTSTLILDVDNDGSVKVARFEPPLAPEVQTCASDAIYKTRFERGGVERITIVAER